MASRRLIAALICLAGCGGSKLGGGGDGGTAGTVGTGQGGAIGAGGDGAGGDGTGGSGTGGAGTAGSGTGGGGTAGSASGGRGGAVAAGGRGGSFSVAGDAGAAGPCASWTPPDAPDGGFSPTPPDAGRPADDRPACVYRSCSFPSPSTVPFDDARLGFTATDLLAKLASPATGSLTWYDGTSTMLHFQVRYDQPTVQLFYSADPGCREMEVDGAVVSVTTDDGRLSGEDFAGRLNGNLLDGQLTIVWQSLSDRHISELRGSFRAPSAWGADVSVQSLTVGVGPRSENCSVCAASSDPRDPSFASAGLGCAYDGKIYWNGMNDPSRGCTPRFTIAAWQFSQHP